MIVALGLAVFAYGFWYINEFYGTTWRVEDAHAEADRWFPFADAAEQVEKSREKKISSERASKEAERTSYFVAAFLWTSFAMSGLALADQFVDIDFLSAPSPIVFIFAWTVVFIIAAIFWLLEFAKTLRIGSVA